MMPFKTVVLCLKLLACLIVQRSFKVEYPFFMYRLFIKIKYLPYLFTVNLPLAYTHFDSFLSSIYRFSTIRCSLIGASEYAQVGLNHTMN